jgi:glyoxylase-like metal-dependent hydrolase (beta-lactamase superfamily II)
MPLARIGDVALDRVPETDGLGFSPRGLFADYDEETFRRHMPWMEGRHYDPQARRLIMSVHSWVLRTERHTILVDTCGGNAKNRPGFAGFHMQDYPWLDRLGAVGVRPEDVDFVLCTHLHVDHVGWNTHLVGGRWVPTFPNARYLASRAEFERWKPKGKPGEEDAVFVDSVLPIHEAGLMQLVDGAHPIDDLMRIEPAPGHTPGSVVLRVESKSERAIFSGDIMHHPIQVYEPHWNSAFCEDQDMARKTRRRVLEACVETGALLLPAHFGRPHGGRIKRQGGAFSIEWGL